MWSCAASSGMSDTRFDEARFLGPGGKVYRANAIAYHGFDVFEVHLRGLGKGRPRQDGWKMSVPEKRGEKAGWLDHKGERSFRYLEISDPRGRRALLEFVDPAPADLYRELGEQLFDEEQKDARQLQPRPVSGGSEAHRGWWEPAPYASGEQARQLERGGPPGQERRLQRPEDGQDEPVEGWLRRYGLLGVDDGDSAAGNCAA